MRLNPVDSRLPDRKTGSATGRSKRLARPPAVEGLEERLLFAVSLPDIAMVSATTSDSQSVTFEYDVKQEALNVPVRFGIYRSADNQFDASDIPIGSTLVLPPGQANATLDSAGQPAGAVGHHELTVPLADGLPPDPKHPFVLVVADPENAVAESDKTDNTASFRTYVIGVVTHGGIQPKSWMKGPPWELRMAADLREQGYDAVIPFNWVFASNHPGAAAEQAPRLAAMVLAVASRFPSSDPVDLHFIGHSEGAVINSQTILRLRATEPPQLRAGYLKVTMLDPHAANTGVAGQQYSVSHGLLGLYAKESIDHFQSRAKDPAVVVPDYVNDAEVFYQHTPVSQAQTNDGIYNLWGQVPVHGPAHYFNLTGPGISHAGKFGVQDWYLLNVVPTLGDGSPFIDADVLSVTQDPATVIGTEKGANVASGQQPSYSGTAAPGATVRLLVAKDGSDVVARVGQTTASSDGVWQLTTRPLAPGRYRVSAVSNAPIHPNPRPIHMRPTAWANPLVVEPGSSNL